MGMDANEDQSSLAQQWEAMMNVNGINETELEANPQAVFNVLKFQQRIYDNQGKINKPLPTPQPKRGAPTTRARGSPRGTPPMRGTRGAPRGISSPPRGRGTPPRGNVSPLRSRGAPRGVPRGSPRGAPRGANLTRGMSTGSIRGNMTVRGGGARGAPRGRGAPGGPTRKPEKVASAAVVQ